MRAACDPEVAKKLLKELDDAEALASKVRAHGWQRACRVVRLVAAGSRRVVRLPRRWPLRSRAAAEWWVLTARRARCCRMPPRPQDQVARKVPLTKAALLSAIDNIRGAVRRCWVHNGAVQQCCLGAAACLSRPMNPPVPPCQVMICYPMGLPEWDFIRQCLEGREDLSGTDVRRRPAWARAFGLLAAAKQRILRPAHTV